MKNLNLTRIALGLLAVAIVLLAAVQWATSSSEAKVEAQAAATVQVPVAAGDEAVGAALAQLPRSVNVRTVDAVRERDDVVIVDVRSASEYASGHVPGAMNIPLEQLVVRASELPGEAKVILTCRTGRRSGGGVDTLESAGVSGVVHMDGGIVAWRRAGLPVEK